MKKTLIAPFLLLILLVALLYPASRYRQQLASPEMLQPLTNWSIQQDGGSLHAITLPHTFHELAPHTSIILTTVVQTKPADHLMIKSVYSSFRLYANGTLLYEAGQDGSYPGYLLDPPTLIQIIPLPDTGKPITLQLEFLSPSQRTELTIPRIEVGDKTALLRPIFQQNGFSFLFSQLLLFLSFLLLIAAFCLARQEDFFHAFLQLGLFSLSVGLWSFGECNLTAFFLPYPSLLYLLSFAGLFTCTIPLLRFGLCILKLHHPLLLRLQIYLLQAAVLIAFLLQLTGKIGFNRSMYFFHIFLPLSLLAFALQIFWEVWKYNNGTAKRFAPPMGILAFFSLLELLNYQLRFTNVLSLFFQIGVFLFILSLGVLCIRFLQNSLRIKEEKQRLEFDLTLAERKTEVQRTQYDILTDHEKRLREQRHDLRHQLIVLKSYTEQGDYKNLQQYLAELTAQIPRESELCLCSNFVVNSVALYYQELAKKQQIPLTMELQAIDKIGNQVKGSDLCIILGNLLENAIEASSYLPPEKRKITVSSMIYTKKLFLLIDNQYDGVFVRKSGTFFSRKRSGKGIGLSSVESVLHKYHGGMECRPEQDTFSISLYLELKN